MSSAQTVFSRHHEECVVDLWSATRCAAAGVPLSKTHAVCNCACELVRARAHHLLTCSMQPLICFGHSPLDVALHTPLDNITICGAHSSDIGSIYSDRMGGIVLSLTLWSVLRHSHSEWKGCLECTDCQIPLSIRHQRSLQLSCVVSFELGIRAFGRIRVTCGWALDGCGSVNPAHQHEALEHSGKHESE